MREPRRRRRNDEEYGGRGLPLFPVVLVVILAGLLLGGALAHFLGGSKGARQAAPTKIAVLPSTAATPAPILTTPPAVTPAPKQSPTPTPLPTGSPSAHPSPAKAPTPFHRTVAAAPHKPSPKPSPTPRPHISYVAKAPAPSATSKSIAAAPGPASSSVGVAGDDRAAALVRSYLEALARGDRATATSYLAHGLPNESFMNADSHIESIRSANVGAQQYRVTADVQTGSGEYYVTFTVEQGPAGLQITDHYAIKPQ
jgi:hypothetical protein